MNTLILTIGWIVFISMVSYIVTFIVKEFIDLVKSESFLYRTTKYYKKRFETCKNKVVLEALKIVVNDYWNVRKKHPDCETWRIDQWYDYYHNGIKEDTENNNK